MKPFLLITTRPEDETARSEREAFLRFTGLTPEQLQWIRAEQEDIPNLTPEAISGIILGGSPFNTTDLPEEKSAIQRTAETRLAGMLDEVIAHDIPFFGACYGVGTLGVHQGATVDRTYGELVGVVPITLTEEGRRDPLIREAGLSDVFAGIVGHKEAISALPDHATVLATGEVAPVQMFRVGTRQYATQFHPELDIPGVIERLSVYRDHGYFEPGGFEEATARLRTHRVEETWRLLRAFATLFAR